MKHIPRRRIASGIALAIVGMGASLAVESDPQDIQHLANAHHEMQILANFGASAQLHAFDLTVRVDGSKATLGGTVDDGISKDLAERIAHDVSGIGSIENRIIVDSSRAPLVSAAKR